MNMTDAPAVLERPALALSDEERTAQFQLRRVQAFNWGTFSGVVDIPVSERGFLFVGKSGSGKSTLLDANAVLTALPGRRRLNTAASDAHGGKRDRNLATYVRGAWSKNSDEQNKAATQFLRKGSTWSAIAQTYRNGAGDVVTLAAVFWILGSGTSERDVKRRWLVLEREFSIKELEFLPAIGFDMRKFKAKFEGDAHISEQFSGYQERFRSLMGIENTNALDLLHRTQTTKTLGELNVFLREFMLDEPQTFERAETLVSQFTVLNDAHRAVVTAREQVEVLKPAREALDARVRDEALLHQLGAEESGLSVFGDELRHQLIEQELERLEQRLVADRLEHAQARARHTESSGLLATLREQRNRMGGADIERMRASLAEVERERIAAERRQGTVADACAVMDRPAPTTPTMFVTLQVEAREMLEQEQAGAEAREFERRELHQRSGALAGKIAELHDEIRALESKRSNIHSTQLDIRSRIAQHLGLDEADLPFVGELLDVKPAEASWQGAIERVLGEFAVSMLVSDADYDRVAGFIDRTHLRGRLRYEHVVRSQAGGRQPSARSLVHKLDVVDGPFRDWVRETLKERFDYECVASATELRGVSRGVTAAGQVKRSSTSHIKDDRSDVNDRRHWVLGSDNAEKLAILQSDGRRLVEERNDVEAQLKSLSERDRAEQQVRNACQRLVDSTWDDIDVAARVSRYAALEAQIAAALETSPDLSVLDERIRAQAKRVEEDQKDVNTIDVRIQKAEDRCRELNGKFTQLADQLQDAFLTESVRDALAARLAVVALAPTLETVEERLAGLKVALAQDAERCRTRLRETQINAQRQFEEFKRRWPVEAADLDTTLASGDEYMAKLERLETDGLQQFEDRFRTLLREQSDQNLTFLTSALHQERRSIFERLDTVNEALKDAPFNTGARPTYLVIEASDRRIEAVTRFYEMLREAQTQMAAAGEDMAADEQRFLVIKELVGRLSSQDPAEKRWRDQVLDVREHVEFIARELDADGTEVEVYDSGEGKSGGQRMKLAATCLAAALRYQLAGREGTLPRFSTVFMDEAFEKTDPEFTETTMGIFRSFGLQMVVATPMKSVKTLSPFIGGAAVVTIEDRNRSLVNLIEYDEVDKRLLIEKLDPRLLEGDEDN